MINAGRLRLQLEQNAGITQARESYAQPPIQLSRARYDDPTCPGKVSFTLLHLGGVLAGDQATLDVGLATGACAEVRAAAATQVYNMQGGTAAHTLNLHLGADCQLAWLNEPLILFAGARFAQSICATLAPGAKLVLLDILVPGRLARGECYRFERYDFRLEVCDTTGRCLVAERALLEPQRRQLGVQGILATTPVVGSLYLLGDTLEAEHLCSALEPQLEPSEGATCLPNNAGVLLRVLGVAPAQVRARLLALWQKINP